MERVLVLIHYNKQQLLHRIEEAKEAVERQLRP